MLNTMADYTQNGRVKLKSTYEPFMRPTFEQWIRDLKISHTVYDVDSQARERAQEINSKMGVKFDERTIWQQLGGEEY